MTEPQPSNPGEPALAIAPLRDIPYAAVELGAGDNPVPAIVADAAFAETTRYFDECPEGRRSLLPPAAQALLYTIIRNQHPAHVVEIGTYNGGTAEGIARALHANGDGMLHTVSPFDAERFGSVYRWWPQPLRERVRYHAVSSMDFFILADAERLTLDTVLVDGNHDHEFAAFDIAAAARRLSPGGFIFIDNVSQAGPFLAATQFCAANPDWIDCGVRPMPQTCERAFDRDRTTVLYTDFFILRAPRYRSAGATPLSFGNVEWTAAPLRGLRVPFAGPHGAGTLRAQCILRGFKASEIDELVVEADTRVERDRAEVQLEFAHPVVTTGEFLFYRVEIWLMWLGPGRLSLGGLPQPT